MEVQGNNDPLVAALHLETNHKPAPKYGSEVG